MIEVEHIETQPGEGAAVSGDVAYVLVREVTNEFYGNVESTLIIGVYLDGCDAERELQRLRDAARGAYGMMRDVWYRVEEVSLHG